MGHRRYPRFGRTPSSGVIMPFIGLSPDAAHEPSVGYMAFLAREAAERVVLVDLRVRIALHGWTSEGSGAYSADLSSYSHPTSLRLDRGLYCDVVGVRENRTALADEVSLAAVQGHAGSWYYDRAAETIYVKRIGSGSPSTSGTLIQAVFVLRLGTHHRAFDGTPPYDAQIDGRTLPSIRADRADLLHGATVFPGGDLAIQNADGFWDYPAAAWLWDNATATVRIGGDNMDFADFEVLAAMQVVTAPTAGDTVATCQLRSRSNVTSRAFPQHTYRDYPDFDFMFVPGFTNLLGASYVPMWWGSVFDAPLQYYGFSGFVPQGLWLAIDPFMTDPSPYEPVFAIDAVYAYEKATGVRSVVPTSDWSGFSGGFFWKVSVALSPWDPELYDLRADMHRIASTGYLTSSGGTTALQTVGQIATDILSWCGVPASEIDAASFAQADIDAPWIISGLYVAGGQGVFTLVTGAELLNQLERSTMSTVGLSPTGLWTCTVWTPCVADFADFPVVSDVLGLLRCDPVTDATRQAAPDLSVRYAHQIGRDVWSASSSSNTVAQAALDSGSSDTVDVLLQDPVEALILRDRLRWVNESHPVKLRIVCGPQLMRSTTGDKIRLMRSRGASLSGTFDQVMEIESIVKRLDTMTCEAVVSNQRGLGESIKGVAPDGTAGWDTASEIERRSYAFVHDDDLEQVDTADVLTYHQALVF